MTKQYQIIKDLTTLDLPLETQKLLLNDFAEAFKWKPSDHFIATEVSNFATVHLLVEHGLENTAVLSFLRYPYNYSDLNLSQKTTLLSLSYNNLVDWHIPISVDNFTAVFNRVNAAQNNSIVESYTLSENNLDYLRSDAFDQITGKRPSPNLPALDNALIDTISHWKRKISAELDNKVSTESLSALFNAVIFARAVEDHKRRRSPQPESINGNARTRLLLECLKGKKQNFRQVIRRAIMTGLVKTKIPKYLLDDTQLEVFDSLSPETIYAIFSDFYIWRSIPYEYDFSVMSKHALSRIYERYVSILSTVESPPTLQREMFPGSKLPKEEKNKTFGSVYTPQFIAKFFAKFLRNQMPASSFMKAKVSDPACGSGIFLRTLLELRYENIQSGITTDFIHEGFQNILGVDLDPNATQATRLSLALLYLALTDEFPKSLNIVTGEAIEYLQKHSEVKNSQDAVIANPPFIAIENQSESIKQRILSFMDNYASGRIGSEIAFLRIGLEQLKPGGYGFFVLPHSFLSIKSAEKMRQTLTEQAWILCLVDLSAVSVFEDVGAYTVLLIFQKKSAGVTDAPPTTIVKCQEFVGQALQDALDQREHEDKYYSVYKVDQNVFLEKDKGWTILPSAETSLKRKLDQFPKVEEFLQVRQGFISGSDDVFIISSDKLPEGEEEIFAPYLRDREMRAYIPPKEVRDFVFYPFLGERNINEEELKTKFPKTWQYLTANKERLKKRYKVRAGKSVWWMPHSMTTPQNMMRPKIVSPHLVIVPRFSLDIEGKYAVSRSPFLYPKEANLEKDLLPLYVALLNSQTGFWYITNSSHIYGGGYSMLEVKSLKKAAVPDLRNAPTLLVRQVLELVNERLISSGSRAIDIEKEIDKIVADLYQLSKKEREVIGIA